MEVEAIQKISAKLQDTYKAVELKVAALLSRRVRNALKTGGWSAEVLGARREVSAIIRDLNAIRVAEVTVIVAAAYKAGNIVAGETLAEFGVMADIEPINSERAILAMARTLNDRLAATDVRILRSVEHVLRDVQGRVVSAEARQIVGEAAMRGLQGELTRRGAAQAAMDAFANSGITGLVDASGKAWNLQSYSEMSTRTAIMNASRQGTFDGVRAKGGDLVQIGGSFGGCELCEPWEGEVLSLDGKTDGYFTLDEAEAAGLFHPNCTHDAGPFVEGVTGPFVKSTNEAVAATYEARQEQRRLERGIRQWKMREQVALSPEAQAKAAGKVKEWQGKLGTHISANDLKRLSYREQITKAV